MNIELSTINSEQSSINPLFDNNTNNDGSPNEYILQQSQTNNNSQEIDNHSRIPKIDSAILFQANNSLNIDEDAISSPLIKCFPSTQIPLISVDNEGDIINSNGSIENFSAIQKSSKLFFPPDIEISNYFNDLFQREIKVPYLMTKEKLLEFIDNYSIENYARTHFRKQQGIILFTNQAIKELTTFSMKPLSKPLLEKTPISKKDIAVKLNTYILLFIDVLTDSRQEEIYKGRRDDYKDDLTMGIVKMLSDEDCLIDEFFMQMIKSMRNSPNQETLLLSWKLFLIMSTLFYVKDQEISNVICWFIIKNIYESENFSDYAHYTFIRFHERNVLEKNCELSNMKREEINTIPLNVKYGVKMFKCSLYTQMWNQKRRFPKLPIPLTPYLVVKTLIKNGVMVTPNPFPDIGRNLPKSSISKPANLNNQVQNQKEDENEIEINEKVDINNNVKKEKSIKAQILIKNDEQNKEENDHLINDNNNANNRLIHYKKANMKIVKMWASNLNCDYEIINDGEVRNLLALVFIWMINLLDPIVPKSMTNSFIRLFKNNTDPSYNDKCKEFVNNLPLLHKNTLKFLVGFFRDIAKNEKSTHETHQTISEYIGFYFVETSFMTIDPFTRKEMRDLSPNFLLYCLDNLDVDDVYPLNPAYEVEISEYEYEEEEEDKDEEEEIEDRTSEEL